MHTLNNIGIHMHSEIITNSAVLNDKKFIDSVFLFSFKGLKSRDCEDRFLLETPRENFRGISQLRFLSPHMSKSVSLINTNQQSLLRML